MTNHGMAVKIIGKFLIRTEDKGLMRMPDESKGLKVLLVADFARGFDGAVAEDPALAHSHTRHVINHSKCPITWKSNFKKK